MRKLIAALIVVTIFLSGCSNSSTVQGVVNTPTKMVEASSTMVPTKTVVPSSTPTILPTPTTKPTSTVTFTPTPTKVVNPCSLDTETPGQVTINLGDLGVYKSFGMPNPEIIVSDDSMDLVTAGSNKISELKEGDTISFIMEYSGIIVISKYIDMEIYVNDVQWEKFVSSSYFFSPEGFLIIPKGSNVKIQIKENKSKGYLMTIQYEEGISRVDSKTRFVVGNKVYTAKCDSKVGLYYIEVSTELKDIIVEKTDKGKFAAFITDRSVARLASSSDYKKYTFTESDETSFKIWFLR